MIQSYITFIYAAVLGLIFVALSVKVVVTRGRKKLDFGDGGIADVQLAVRTHGNFAEYVPFALLLLLGTEMLQWPVWIIHTLGGVLIFARIIHAYGLKSKQSPTAGRVVGATLTWLVIAITSILILVRSF